MKMPLDWHKGCLLNMKATLDRLLLEIARLEKEKERLYADILNYQHQIDTAQKEGKSAFDSDKYMMKRRKNEYRF